MVTPQMINEMLRDAWPSAGVTCLEVSPVSAVARLPVTAIGVRPGGLVSGPTQFACVDAALWFLANGALGRVEPMAVTQELSIRYLRPAVGDVIFAEATLERHGKRALVGTVRVWTDDKNQPTATAQGTYRLPR